MATWNAVCLLLATLAALATASPLLSGRPSPRPSRAMIDRSKSMLGMADPVRPRVHASRRARPAGPSSRAEDAESHRLPTALRPYHYYIELTTQLPTSFEFEGYMEVYINTIETASKIVLHAKEISFNAEDMIVYVNSGGYLFTWAYVDGVTFDEESETAIIDIDYPLLKGGKYVLRIKSFTGKLNDDLDGFYRSTYTTSSGEIKWLATTQFEPTGARRAFPCWDEPEYKARFDITITHPSTYSALSNLPLIESKSAGNNMMKDKFMSTLPMSTYLVAFIVSDFGSVTNDGGNFTTWARKELISGATLAQEVGPAALKVLSDFNGVDYSLPKMDQAAIPDFAAGAMENWGLVTYREEYLIETADTTTRLRESIATVICHEFGHQWTGDLLTLDWWEHTWLNEGFATFYENIICNQIKPEWNLEDKMVSGSYHVAMESDARETQVAMSAPVNSDAEIDSRFGVISYDKGGAVLRMFYHALTPEVFKKGMKRYLSNNWFKNVNPGHLFKAFNAEIEISDEHQTPGGTSFADLASTWTEQPGVPVLSATRDYTSGEIRFTQKRFLYAPASDESLVSQKWYIPLVVTSQAKPDFETTLPQGWLVPLLDYASMPSGATADQWVLVNPKATGYFRVNYDETNWKLLAAALASSPSTIHPASRAQLLNDALSLARAGQLEYSLALPFLQALKQERSVAVWQAAITATNYLRARLDTTEANEPLLALMKDVTTSAFDELGYTVPDSEEHDKSYLRYYIASKACLAGNSKCLTAAASALKAWLASPSSSPLQPDTRGTSLCFGVRGSDATTFEAMRQRWLAETNADTRFEYVSALACSGDRKLLTGLLADAVALKYEMTDGVDVFNAVFQYTWNHAVLLDFTKENADAILETFGNNFDVQVLSALIRDVRTRTELSEVRAWVEAKYQAQDSWKVLQRALAAVETELENWFDKYYYEVLTWMQFFTGMPTSAPFTSRAPSTSASPDVSTGSSTRAATTPATESTTTGGVGVPTISAAVLLLALFCATSMK